MQKYDNTERQYEVGDKVILHYADRYSENDCSYFSKILIIGMVQQRGTRKPSLIKGFYKKELYGIYLYHEERFVNSLKVLFFLIVFKKLL